MHEVTRTSGLVGIVLLIACYITPVQAQGTSPAPAPSTASPKQPRQASGGLKATIVNSIIDEKGNITVQIAISNETKNRQSLFWIGSFKGGLSTGEILKMVEVAGITVCNEYNNYDEGNAERCMEKDSKKTDLYSYIEPGDLITISLRFEPSNRERKIKSESTFSYTLKYIVREGPTDADALKEKADEKTIGPPHIGMINFSLVPLKAVE